MPVNLCSEIQEPRDLQAGPDRNCVVFLDGEQLRLLGREFVICENALGMERAQALELGNYVLIWGRWSRWWCLLDLFCMSVIHGLRIGGDIFICLPAVYGITGGGRCADYGSGSGHTSY